MSRQFSKRFETINDLGAVHGGEGNAAVCAEQVASATALGALAGGVRGGGLALLCRLIAGSFRSHRKFFVKRIDAGSPA
jgi:hypothetical protein